MTENDKQIQDEKENINPVISKNDDKKSKKAKSKIPTEIHLKDYFLKKEIKATHLKNFCKKNIELFEDDCKNFVFENINEVKIDYINKIIDLVPDVINSKTKYIYKKLFEFIFKKHHIKINRFPISKEDFKSFINYQRKYILNNRDTPRYKEIKEIELQILKILLVLLYDKDWFDVDLFIKTFEPFKKINSKNEIGEIIKYFLASGKKDPKILITFSSILENSLEDINNEKTKLLSDSINLEDVLSKNKRLVVDKENEIKYLEALVLNLKQNIKDIESKHQSETRISSVNQTETNGKVIKSITNLLNGEIFIASEMLSDGDEFHGRILKKVDAINLKLKELRDWLTSME